MRTVVVTGATSGIGLAVAHHLLDEGYRVIGVGHSEHNSQQAWHSLTQAHPESDIHFVWGDLMQQREVRRLASELITLLDRYGDGRLFCLINNAGCARGWYATTDEAIEQQFALNHLAGFLLTHYVWPYLLRGNGRVIMTGSASYRGMKMNWDDIMFQRRYRPLRAYKQSKLCNLLFAVALNHRYAASGIRASVVDPGLVTTDIGFKQAGRRVALVWRLRKKGGVSPAIPARTYAWLCADPPPEGLYFYNSQEKGCSSEVTLTHAKRLFSLSETLCGITFGRTETTEPRSATQCVKAEEIER